MAKTRTDTAIALLEKQYGKGVLVRLGAKGVPVAVDVIPTGSLTTDRATCVGGLPRGRVIEIFGPECLDADTLIQYSAMVNGRRANHKGGTIKRLHERFHKLPSDGDGRGKYARCVTENAEFYAPSMNEQGRIVANRIVNVVHSGPKDCFLIATEHSAIVASAVHRFWTGSEYAELRKLKVGDNVYLHLNTPFRADRPKDSSGKRVDLYVKHHPVAGVKTISAVVNRKSLSRTNYRYHRLSRARAVMEAQLNGLSLAAFVDLLNASDPSVLNNLQFLPRDAHVHHKDEDVTNDDPQNLEVVSAEKHGRYHALQRHNNLRFVATVEKIKSITYAGLRDTYDIQMEEPLNNFVANKFVVHNSGGKTTFALQVIAQAQKDEGQAAFIDAEHALDLKYAKRLGVNVDDLLVSQPDYGEQALEIAEALIKTEEFDVIVVDSVAALVPKAELDGEMGDAQMGLQARLMSQAMRKLTAAVARSKTILIFINQIRDKIGVMFGSPETTTGGRALKFYASIRIDIRRISSIKSGDAIVGAKTRAKIVKNKVGVPFREATFDLIYGQGTSRGGELVDLGVEYGLLTKSGSWITDELAEEKIGQGRDQAIAYFEENPKAAVKLEDEIRYRMLEPSDEKNKEEEKEEDEQ